MESLQKWKNHLFIDLRQSRALPRELDILPEEAVFVDDSQKNIDAAISYGLKAIKFSETNSFKKDIYNMLK